MPYVISQLHDVTFQLPIFYFAEEGEDIKFKKILHQITKTLLTEERWAFFS